MDQGSFSNYANEKLKGLEPNQTELKEHLQNVIRVVEKYYSLKPLDVEDVEMFRNAQKHQVSGLFSDLESTIAAEQYFATVKEVNRLYSLRVRDVADEQAHAFNQNFPNFVKFNTDETNTIKVDDKSPNPYVEHLQTLKQLLSKFSRQGELDNIDRLTFDRLMKSDELKDALVKYSLRGDDQQHKAANGVIAELNKVSEALKLKPFFAKNNESEIGQTEKILAPSFNFIQPDKNKAIT